VSSAAAAAAAAAAAGVFMQHPHSVCRADYLYAGAGVGDAVEVVSSSIDKLLLIIRVWHTSAYDTSCVELYRIVGMPVCCQCLLHLLLD
jgi:hypothetical protein